MQLLTSPTKGLLIASVLVLAPSCAGRDASVEFLPPPPAALVTARQDDPRPVLPDEALESEEAFDTWQKDVNDWGDRRDGLAYRWCKLVSRFTEEPLDCGPSPLAAE